MFEGQLLGIHVCAAGADQMKDVHEIKALAGLGLQGDRYATGQGSYQRGVPGKSSQQVTLIEIEAIRAAAADYNIDVSPGATRRNLVTESVPLNHLVDRTFSVGPVILRGIELCEPCGHLERLATSGLKKALAHRGGLRAEIVTGGTLRIGDSIRPAD